MIFFFLFLYFYLLLLFFILSDPYEVHVGSMDLQANIMIKQIVEVVSDYDKYTRLLHHLRDFNDGSRVLIFVETKRGCDQLQHSLRQQNLPVGSMHGDKSQQDRDRVLQDFRSGHSPMLVATDVAARGLDIKDIRIVINFDMPNTIEDYVHRIGRTGRAGAKGVSVSFFTEKHGNMARKLIEILGKAKQDIPRELEALSHSGGGGGGGGGRGGGRRY